MTSSTNSTTGRSIRTCIRSWSPRLRTGSGYICSADRPFLYYSKAPNYVTVYDGRNPNSPIRRRYEGLAALVIEICNESAKSVGQIRTAVGGQTDCSDAILQPILNDLTAQRVLYEEPGKYFTLAIPENPYLEPDPRSSYMARSP